MDELTNRLSSTDPAISLRAVGALHRLAERVEACAVAQARDQGWTWEQIGAALGVTRQSAHTKHGK
ncbi:helix-turn-helix domain-containing protein [Nocardia sp. CDC153]|uniref:helix-turn-helix domain-containing protein n=1 Tax=Nocardia sp. CDC153 TaxID=3112167 RepID=UPI002DB8E1F4|nr:helix-turn-helix domain-containing protein [Nocardia sp. CDC153]MEC3957844.1 helix-turn-helix domain-containing protein [Nocardia sp. CDC153]